MNLVTWLLLLFQSVQLYGFSIHAPEDCLDFTVGDCSIPSSSIIQEFAVDDISLCQEICRQLSSCILFSHDGAICKLLNKEYRKGCGTVGAPVNAPMDTCQDAIVESCSGFDEENCEYLGEHVGEQPEDGEIFDPLVCQAKCDEQQGCTFWVYKDKEQSCQFLKSSERSCSGISGPRAPPIEDCLHPTTPKTTTHKTTTSTHKPTTTTEKTTTITQKPGCAYGEEFMGICYELVATYKNWQKSSKDCVDRGGDLASIYNEEVNTHLAHLSSHTLWIGGSDFAHEGLWVWPNGDEIIYSNWGDQEFPSHDNKDCLKLNYDTNHGRGRWNDDECDRTYYHICQFPINHLK